MANEPDDLASRMRALREEAQADSLPARSAEAVLGPARAVRSPESAPPDPNGETTTLPLLPDGTAVNRSWDVRPALTRGGLIARFLRRMLAPIVGEQVTFNSRQVQLDNEILEYLTKRFEATHRHYDALLGIHGRHITDINERHLLLQEDLVAHVHDLVRRIDLTLEQAERTRVSLESALREMRARLTEIESRIAGK
jgi:hypothetical protein